MGLNNVTWSSELGLGQSIILIAYVIGYLIIYFHQKNKIGALKEQIDTQKGILDQIERFMNMFSVDKLEYFEKLSTKTAQMEKELAIKEIKSKAQKSFDYALKEYDAVLGLAYKLVDGMTYFPTIEIWLNEMEDVQTKSFLLEYLKKRRRDIESEGIGKREWVANFVMGLNLWGFIEEKKSHPSSPQK